MPTKLDQLEKLLRQRGMLRTGELPSIGFPMSYLSELEKRGQAVKQSRGLYAHPDAEMPRWHSLALACRQVPNGVVTLLSALAFHGIGTQHPSEVWMAIEHKAHPPKPDYPPIRYIRFSGPAFEEGVEQAMDGTAAIRVYNPAKTIADCFKFRNKVGTDVAVEALREGWRSRRFSMDDLVRYARICRVERVMTPYIEAIV